MAKRSPLPDWTGEDVYLIGGGSSLKGFEWGQLKPLNTIGCNHAFQLGKSICHIAMFGDWLFWCKYETELERFGGWVATNYTPPPADFIHHFKRQDEGLSTEPDVLAWNGNTGACAINLALLLGASRVYLLGYDLGDGLGDSQPQTDQRALLDRSHWHDDRMEVPIPAVYDRMNSNFFAIAQALPVSFPQSQIFNVSEGTSRLKCFPIVNFRDAGLDYGT